MRAPQIVPRDPGVPSPSQLRIVLRLTMRENRITEVEAIADAERLGRFDLTLLT